MRRAFVVFVLCFLCLGTACTNSVDIPSEWNEDISSDGVKIVFDAKIDSSIDQKTPQFSVFQTTFKPEACVSLINYFAEESVEQEITYPHIENYKTTGGMDIQCAVYKNYFFLQKFSDGLIQLESWIIPGDAFPGEPKGTTLDNIHISKEAAIAIADGTLNELGIGYMSVIDANKARILTSQYQIKSEGWYISYARGYSSYHPIDLSAILPNFNTLTIESGQKAPWLPEMIFMYIDETGVQIFQWSDPILISDEIHSRDKILPFSKLQDAIRNYFRDNYLWDMPGSTAENSPCVFRIVLTGALLSNESDLQSGYILPTWAVFYTTQTHIQDYCNPSVVCFSAIDGTKVDPFVLWKNEDLQ